MKQNISFSLINTYGKIQEETKTYQLYRLPEVSDRYDSNFIQLKFMPNEKEFKDYIELLKVKAKQFGYTHGKVVFPENEAPTEQLKEFAKEQGFEWSFLELFSLQPHQFKAGSTDLANTIQIEYVSDNTLEPFLQMHFDESVQWGKDYANNIRDYKRKLIQNGQLIAIVALENGEVIGSTDIIQNDEFVEIDNFFVKPTHQKRGIGTKIQQFVIQLAKDRAIILVADGEDTPRDMYVKQGYIYEGYQYAVLKSNLFGE